MFTGIVLERGRVRQPRPSPHGGVRLELELSPELFDRLGPGDSLAVDGVCLTVTERPADPSPRVAVELSPETLRRTRLGDLAAGHEVNLEPALRAGDALGGHWVQGHVDGILRVIERRDLEQHRELTFELPSEYVPYVVEKGSVSLDGVSLTVSARAADRFAVALIPHTLTVTTLGSLEVGDRVHLEVDVLAKYVASTVQHVVEQAVEQAVEGAVEQAVDRALAARGLTE